MCGWDAYERLIVHLCGLREYRWVDGMVDLEWYMQGIFWEWTVDVRVYQLLSWLEYRWVDGMFCYVDWLLRVKLD